MEIKWTDVDAETGARRFIKADRFAGFWRFHHRATRRGEWTRLHPTLEVWEEVLDALQRRYQRREGVSDEDLKQVRGIIRDLKARHAAAEDDA